MRFTAQAEEADIDVVQRSLTRAGAEEVGSFFKSVAAVTRAEHQLVVAGADKAIRFKL